MSVTKQLKVGDILKVVKQLKDGGMTLTEINVLPIYIGDDEELNAIHRAYYFNYLDGGEDSESFCDLMEESGIRRTRTEKAVLIS